MAARARTPAVLGAALLGLAFAACAKAPPPVRGVVLITIDTLRADHVGGAASLTPELDALASEGAVITDAFTPTPTTGPAHVSLFSGLHPWNHRVLNNAVPLGEGYATLAELAREAGYATAAVVSSFVLDARFGFDRGFDSYLFEADKPLNFRGELREAFFSRGFETTNHAKRVLDELVADGGPFFLWVHYFDPHFPYDPPPAFGEPEDTPVDLRGRTLPEQVASVEALEDLVRRYRGEVRYTDRAVGRLVRHVDELGLRDEVAVVVTSDHGEAIGDHGHLGHGVNLYNELVRVPLLVRAPGVPAGRRLEGTAQLEDLFPTLAGLMGVEVPPGLDGIDLLPWLRGEVDASPRPAAVGRRKTYEGQPTLFFEWRKGEKWIGQIDAPGKVYAADWQDLEDASEPGEGAPGWLRFKTEGGDLSDVTRGELDPEVEEGLRALGYLESEDD